MDLFIIKGRLKLMLWFVGVACVGGIFGSWYAWTQIDLGVGRERFLLSSTVTGALALAWVVLLILFLSARRVMQQGGMSRDHGWDRIPWWFLKCSALLVLIGIMAVVIPRLSSRVENEFTLLEAGELSRLLDKITTEPELLERKDKKSGKTLLELALDSGDAEAVDVLLSSGAQLAILTNSHHLVTASLNQLPLLDTLLRHGADAGAPDAGGMAPLHYAVEAGNTNALTALLNAGADVNVRDPLDQTPLLLAIMADNLSVAELLISYGADLNRWDRLGDTALHKAVRRRNPETTRFLLEKGADPRTFNLTDMAPLHIAALNGQNELVELFLEQPGMIDLRNEDDRTAFDHALRSRKYETVQLLVDHGAAIDRVMKNGYTATHLMVIAKDYQAARFLIEAGADIHLAGPSGETAYELIRNKQLQILLDLVEVRDNPPGVAHTNTVHSIE